MSLIKIDFGSGYNPCDGYKTCDMTGSPYLDYWYDMENNIIWSKKGELEKGSVSEFRIKNVLHHVVDVECLVKLLSEYLMDDGKLLFIEPKEQYYRTNIILDYIWYRYVQQFYEIKIICWYREFISIFLNNGFKIESVMEDEVYDIVNLVKVEDD